jgi:hypothetical protein
MMNHHKFLLTAGILLVGLGTTLPALAQPARITPNRYPREITPGGGNKQPAKTPGQDTQSPGPGAQPDAPSEQVDQNGAAPTGGGSNGGGVSNDGNQRPGVIQIGNGRHSSIGTKLRVPAKTVKPAGMPPLASGPGQAPQGTARPLTGVGDPTLVPSLDIAIENGKVVMRDVDTNRVLIDTTGRSFWDKYGDGQFKKKSVWAVPTITITEKPGGFDVHYTFTNTAGVPALMGELFVPGIKMPRTFKTRRTFMDGAEYEITRGAGNGHWVDRAYNYPSQSYSPVLVFSDDEYTIGVSLMYPIVEYQHSVHMRFTSFSAPAGEDPKWAAAYQMMMGYGLNPFFPDDRSYLQPGQTREYTISVRVIKNRSGDHPNRWLQTLTPYREYFQNLYGGVKYPRDPRPIVLMSVANREQNHDPVNNPRSYQYTTSRAPDKFGFGPWAEYMRLMMSRGVYRFNLIAVSGAQWSEGSLNNPFLVATPFFNEPALALARQSIDELKSVVTDGGVLGFWWGRSSTVAFGWDTGVNEPLDPSNPVHMAAAFAEIEAALEMGATTFGMDDFKKMPTWDAYRYISEIRQKYPQVQMVIEPMPADVLHSVAPGLIFMNRPQGQENFAAELPHALADFLLPGHEIWGTIRATPFYESGVAKKGMGVPEWALREVAERSANNGYSPVIFGEPDIRTWDINAKESWLVSVPDDLRD